MLLEEKGHLVRKKQFVTKKEKRNVTKIQSVHEKKPSEQQLACSHLNEGDPNLKQVDRSLSNDQNSIKDTSTSTENEPQTNSPKTSPEIGIFKKISGIWMNRNENTASDDQQKNKNKPDLVKNIKKLFKT